jgi:hypothetical protein
MRMRSRKVSEADVEAVLADPDEVREAQDMGHDQATEIYTRLVRGRRIKVYVETGSDPPLVLTVTRSKVLER